MSGIGDANREASPGAVIAMGRPHVRESDEGPGSAETHVCPRAARLEHWKRTAPALFLAAAMVVNLFWLGMLGWAALRVVMWLLD